MIQLAGVAWIFDAIASGALAVLAGIFGLLPARLVMPMFIRKRGEVALIWALACAHRGCDAAGDHELALYFHIGTAVVTLLSAATASQCLCREVRRAS